MNSRTLAVAAAIVLTTGVLGGCRKKVEPAPGPTTSTTTTTTTSSTSSTDSARTRADSIARAERARADSLAAARATAAEVQRLRGELLAQLQERVYFDYDRDNLRDDALTVLDAKAAILLANPGVTVAITGHTDERGTAEYNLALGQRRAAQVKRYLVSKGVSEERLSTQSLGDSEPLAAGADEGAYQQNRRAEFAPANVAAALVRP